MARITTNGFSGATSKAPWRAGPCQASWGGQFYGPNRAPDRIGGGSNRISHDRRRHLRRQRARVIPDPIRILGAFGAWKSE